MSGRVHVNEGNNALRMSDESMSLPYRSHRGHLHLFEGGGIKLLQLRRRRPRGLQAEAEFEAHDRNSPTTVVGVA